MTSSNIFRFVRSRRVTVATQLRSIQHNINNTNINDNIHKQFIIFNEKTSIQKLLNEDIKKRYKKLNKIDSSIVPVFLDQQEQIHPDIFSRLEVELDIESAIDKTKAQKNAILIY